MTAVFTVFLVVHGLIHLLGFAKAFGIAELPQLTQPITPLLGVLWLIAGALFLATAASLFVWPRSWWVIGACAIVVSAFVIVPSWIDAKFGMVANLIALVGVVFGFLAQGPASLRAAYDRDMNRAVAHVAPVASITDADLADLPAPVQRYLRATGVVGLRASTTSEYACMGGSEMVPRRDGSPSQRSSTTSSTSQRVFSI
jgi:hypothetical protein